MIVAVGIVFPYEYALGVTFTCRFRLKPGQVNQNIRTYEKVPRILGFVDSRAREKCGTGFGGPKPCSRNSMCKTGISGSPDAN